MPAGADMGPLPMRAKVASDTVAVKLERFLRIPQTPGIPFVYRQLQTRHEPLDRRRPFRYRGLPELARVVGIIHDLRPEAPGMRASLASRPVAASPVSRPARPPLTLRSSWLLSRPRRSVAPECFGRNRYLLQPFGLIPAGAIVAGRGSHPQGDGTFPRRTNKSG